MFLLFHPRFARSFSLRKNDAGVAFVEFALSLPLLLLVVFGGIEMARYLMANQKLDRATANIVNVITQAQSYDPADVQSVLSNADRFMQPFDLTSTGAIIVTSIQRRGGGETVVTWQQRIGNGSYDSKIGKPPAGKHCFDATLPAGFALSYQGANAIIVEGNYQFRSLMPNFILALKDIPPMYYRAIYVPRSGNLANDGTDPCPNSPPP